MRLEIGKVLKVLTVAGHEGQGMFHGCGRDDQIEGSLSDPFVFTDELLTKAGTAPGDRCGEGEDGRIVEKSADVAAGDVAGAGAPR